MISPIIATWTFPPMTWWNLVESLTRTGCLLTSDTCFKLGDSWILQHNYWFVLISNRTQWLIFHCGQEVVPFSLVKYLWSNIILLRICSRYSYHEMQTPLTCGIFLPFRDEAATNYKPVNFTLESTPLIQLQPTSFKFLPAIILWMLAAALSKLVLH